MTNFSDLSNSLADAAQAVSKSVVSVRAARPISGTVIGKGLVLTVAHVLHADELTVVTASGQELKAVVAGRDPSSDLALLKVDGLDAPALSASAGARVGELLLAVGQPPHGTQATLGFVERQPSQSGPGRGWMPSGAAPFRGVSGGALVDARGGLVGILNAGIMRGSLLAVPAERAMKVADLLDTTGRVPRGYLGLATQPVHLPGNGADTEATPEQRPEGERPECGPGGRGRGHRDHHERGPEHRRGWGRGPAARGMEGRGPWGRMRGGRFGLTVVQVEDGSPAAGAGLKIGDILLALDGEGIRHPRELLGRVRDRAGESLTLRVLRGGEEQDVTLTVGER